MSRLEVEAIASGTTGMRLLARSIEGETSARAALLECAAKFSPRIEDASRGTACVYVLDIAGADRLFGPPETLTHNLRSSLASAGFHVTIAVSRNFHTARIKAESSRSIVVIPPGEEAGALARLPISLLELPDNYAETFAIWGIRTMGELAALPEAEIVTRLGPEAGEARSLALGLETHNFQPIEPVFLLKELCEFETPVERMDSLLFVGARMIECLAARAEARALALASLTMHMSLAGGRVHTRVIRPALPAVDRKFLLKLLHLEIAAHPPESAVHAFTLTAEAGHSSKVQLGLFTPQMPEPSRLDVTIARLKAIIGEDRVGSPVLEDTHHSGSFHLDAFSLPAKSNATSGGRSRMTLRRMRPALPIRVIMQAAQPAIFHDEKRSFKVVTAFGPWRTSGCWWSVDSWDADEWDVLAQSHDGPLVACLLACNRRRNQWQLEAYYD